MNQTHNFEVYISDTLDTLKQSQSLQTKKENADSKQGYNHAKFERFCFNGHSEKANIKGLLFF